MTNESPESAASPDSADAPEVDPSTEPVDTEQLERAQEAIEEGHDAAAKALEPPPGG